MKVVLAFRNPAEFDEQFVNLLNRFNFPATFYLSAKDMLRPWIKLVYRGSFEIGCAGLFGNNLAESSKKEFPFPVYQPTGEKLSWLEVETIWTGWMIQGIFSIQPRTSSPVDLEQTAELAKLERIFPLCRKRSEEEEFLTEENFETYFDMGASRSKTHFRDEKQKSVVIFSIDIAKLTTLGKFSIFGKLLEILNEQRIKGEIIPLTYADYLFAQHLKNSQESTLKTIPEVDSDSKSTKKISGNAGISEGA